MKNKNQMNMFQHAMGTEPVWISANDIMLEGTSREKLEHTIRNVLSHVAFA